MDWTPVYKVSALAFLIGIVFGAVAQQDEFLHHGRGQ